MPMPSTSTASSCQILALLGAVSCSGAPPAGPPDPAHLARLRSARQAELGSAEQRGRRTWFESTFGGEKLFSLLLPRAPFDLQLGIDAMLTSDRKTRFDRWGAVNDPDCVAGDASTGMLDRCADPRSTGVVGIRKFPDPAGGPPLIGVACASCHAGLDPLNPPADPNHPRWDNIDATIGNQFLQIGKLFGAHLAESDPRWQVFHTWAPGTVDTTVIENDHINNPSRITPIANLRSRPFFDLTYQGQPIRVHRMAHGGEDDAGCEVAVLRVYFNLGMCANECMIGHLANGPGGTQTEIDRAACRGRCPELVQAEQRAGDVCAFLDSARGWPLVLAPGGLAAIDWKVVARGARVFARACAGCHQDGRPLLMDVLSNDEIHPMAAIGTNSCRARTTNWMAGHIWGQFSSDQYKQRPTGGPGFYRTTPLVSIWATAPFFDNNRLGLYNDDPSVRGRLAAYDDAMEQLLYPDRRDLPGSVLRTTVAITLPTPGGPTRLPAGTPVATFASLDPRDPAAGSSCRDLFENQGHTYGSDLSDAEKHALKEFLKTR